MNKNTLYTKFYFTFINIETDSRPQLSMPQLGDIYDLFANRYITLCNCSLKLKKSKYTFRFNLQNQY